VDCINQPHEPNDFVLLKLATNKAVFFLWGLITEMGPDFYNTRFLRKRYTFWQFCFAETEDITVANPVILF